MTIPKWVRYPIAAVLYLSALLYSAEIVHFVIALFDAHPVFTIFMFLCGPFAIVFIGLLGAVWFAYSFTMGEVQESITRKQAWSRFITWTAIALFIPQMILAVVSWLTNVPLGS